jgi:hypothetical protein
LFRRLLEQAVQVEPVSYRSLVMNPLTKITKPLPPVHHRTHPASFAEISPGRPWRDYNM